MFRHIINATESSIKLVPFQNNQWSSALPNYFKINSYSTSTTPTKADPQVKKNVSKAMKSYLERARAHDEFMKQQHEEFHIGKRHLANMMGENPDTFTQEDIDNAIEYLFPSGLFEKRARPFMKPPEEVFPQRKAAEFDETGRPHHFLFYTGKPNFYKLMHDIVDHINEAYKFEDTMNRKGIKPDPNLKMDLSGYQWLDKESLEKELVETIGEKDYESFTGTLERLCQLPYAHRSQDFIMKYKRAMMSHERTYQAPKPQYDENGRAFITTYECTRKWAKGHVTLRCPGTGKITINGEDLSYFKQMQSREQVRNSLNLGQLDPQSRVRLSLFLSPNPGQLVSALFSDFREAKGRPLLHNMQPAARSHRSSTSFFFVFRSSFSCPPHVRATIISLPPKESKNHSLPSNLAICAIRSRSPTRRIYRSVFLRNSRTVRSSTIFYSFFLTVELD